MNLMGSSASLWDPNSGLTSVKNVNWILMWPNLWKKRNWIELQENMLWRRGKLYQGPGLKTHFRHFPFALNSKLYYSFQTSHGGYAVALTKTNKQTIACPYYERHDETKTALLGRLSYRTAHVFLCSNECGFHNLLWVYLPIIRSLSTFLMFL